MFKIQKESETTEHKGQYNEIYFNIMFYVPIAFIWTYMHILKKLQLLHRGPICLSNSIIIMKPPGEKMAKKMKLLLSYRFIFGKYFATFLV